MTYFGMYVLKHCDGPIEFQKSNYSPFVQAYNSHFGIETAFQAQLQQTVQSWPVRFFLLSVFISG